MNNLTKEQRIVKTSPDLSPVPAHELVVFKQHDSGRTYFTTVRPGNPFKPTFLDRTRFTFAAYAVNMDPNLRHKFSRKFKHKDQLHYFSLNFLLKIAVADSRKLVEKLEGDPLRRLEEEVAEVAGAAVALLPWDDIRHGNSAISEALGSGADVAASPMGRLRGFAEGLGFELKALNLGRSLTEDELEVEKTRRDLEQSSKIKDLRKTHKFKDMVREEEEQCFGQKLEIARADRLREIQKYKDDAEFEAARVHRTIMMQDRLAESAARAIDQAANSVNSYEELQKAARSLDELRALASTASGRGSWSDSSRALTEGSKLYLPQESADGISQLISKVFSHLDKVKSDNQEKLPLISSVLHLVGEQVLDDQADPEIVDRYAGKVQEAALSMKKRMDVDAFNFFTRKLCDKAQMKDFVS